MMKAPLNWLVIRTARARLHTWGGMAVAGLPMISCRTAQQESTSVTRSLRLGVASVVTTVAPKSARKRSGKTFFIRMGDGEIKAPLPGIGKCVMDLLGVS